MGPVVVLATRRAGQFLPPLFRVLPLRIEQRPECGAVDHHAVVDVHLESRVRLARRVAGCSRRRTTLGALSDEGNELGQLDQQLLNTSKAALGLRLAAFLAIRLRLPEIVQLAFEAALLWEKVLGEQIGERSRCPTMNAHPSDKALLCGREWKIDRPVLIHFLVVLEERCAKPLPQVRDNGTLQASPYPSS